MIERYIQLRMITDFYIPLIVIATIAGLSVFGLIIKGIIRMWEKRQQRIIDWYFDKHKDEDAKDKCHGCFGAANNDCERCMDGNEK